MDKWIALALLGLGIAALLRAIVLDKTASFNDGTFIGEILLGAIGGVFCIAGLIWLAIIVFRHA